MNKKGIIKLGTLALAITFLAACSAEVTSEDPGPPPPAKPVSSPKTQQLKVNAEDEKDVIYNELQLANPTKQVTYFFDYSPSKDLILSWTDATRAGINCDSGKATVATSWIKLNEKGEVLEDVVWASLDEGYKVEQGFAYKLRITISNLQSCEFLGLSFAIVAEEAKSYLIKEQPLVLRKDYFLSPSQREADMYYDFTFWSSTQKDLYFSYISEGVDTRCENVYRRQMEWITLDSNGLVVKSEPLKDFGDFRALPNTHHILRIRYVNAHNCQFFNLGFAVAQ